MNGVNSLFLRYWFKCVCLLCAVVSCVNSYVPLFDSSLMFGGQGGLGGYSSVLTNTFLSFVPNSAYGLFPLRLYDEVFHMMSIDRVRHTLYSLFLLFVTFSLHSGDE